MNAPEPANGTALFWPPRSADELAFCIVRDDTSGHLFHDGTGRWFMPNIDWDADPATWPEVQEWMAEEGLTPDAATVLHPAGGERQ